MFLLWVRFFGLREKLDKLKLQAGRIGPSLPSATGRLHLDKQTHLQITDVNQEPVPGFPINWDPMPHNLSIHFYHCQHVFLTCKIVTTNESVYAAWTVMRKKSSKASLHFRQYEDSMMSLKYYQKGFNIYLPKAFST